MRGMQRFMSAAVWEEDTLRETYPGLVAPEMGDPQGGFMVDASGCVKKGQESVGVARQYCGTLGKVDQSPVGGVPPRPRGRVRRWWPNAFSCPNSGAATPTRSDDTRVRGPRR